MFFGRWCTHLLLVVLRLFDSRLLCFDSHDFFLCFLWRVRLRRFHCLSDLLLFLLAWSPFYLHVDPWCLHWGWRLRRGLFLANYLLDTLGK